MEIKSILIKDTTKEERIRIVQEGLNQCGGACDFCNGCDRAREVGVIMRPPEIENSTEEERREYIKNTFRCIADCDMCGLCTVFRGKDPEVAYADYINGKRVYLDVSKDYR